MPKSFEFYGGGQPDMDALASVLGAGIEAELQSGAMRVQAIRDLAQAFERVNSEKRERDNKYEYLAAEAARERAFKTSEREESEKFEAKQRGFSALVDIAERGISEQGLSAEDLLQRFQGMSGLEGAGAAPAPGPVQGPAQAGMPQSLLEGPGFGTPDAGIMRLGVGAGTFPAFAPPAPQQAGDFSNIRRVPIQPSVEQQRFNREVEIDAETQGAIAQATQFANSPQGQKILYHPVKRSRLAALGLEGVDPEVLDQEITDLFPEVKPVPGIDGKEDRTKLDRKLKWLEKEIEVQVPSETGFMQGRQFLAQRLRDPDSLKKAMESIAPPTDLRPARSLKDAQQVADEYLLKQMQARKSATTGVHIEGGEDLLAMIQEVQHTQAALRQPTSAVWTKPLIQGAGFEYDQLPQGLQSAAAARMPVAADEAGRIVFVPRQDGTQPAPNWQAELDEFQQRHPEVLQALMATGAEQSQTPRELKRATTKRQIAGKGTPQAAPAAEPRPGVSAPSAPEQPPQRPRSALDAYREYQAGKNKTPAPPRPKSTAAPRSMSLYGLSESELQRLLAGAGGLR